MTWRRLAAALPALVTVSSSAQVNAGVDRVADGPTGIVADPCAARPAAAAGRDRAEDFGQLCRYAAANAALTERPRVVFAGDSITDNWINLDPGFFGHGIVDRGIGGQTTPQLLVRFRQDVIELRPRAVHLMIGTNDIAGNTGAATMATVTGNIATMAELAHAHGIRVILASLPPAAAFPWAPDKRPVAQIAALNRWIERYARANGHVWVDYTPVLATPAGAMRPGLSSDGVHPTAAGYAAMRPLAEAAVRRALAR